MTPAELKEPEIIKRKGNGESFVQKLYRTNKKFREEWDDFIETLEVGKQVGYRKGLLDGARRERKAILREVQRCCKSSTWVAPGILKDWLADRTKKVKK